MKYSNLDDYLRETENAELIVGLCKLYYYDGRWFVMKRETRGSLWKLWNSFDDDKFESALRYMDDILEAVK
jgi:hypothetical protein